MDTIVSADDVKEAIDKKQGVIVDVRTPEEYAKGHIAGSVLVTLQTLQENLDKIPDKGKTFYLYCQRGIRSAKAVEILNNLGYTNVHSMSGGIEAWMSKNYPVQK